MLHLNAPLNKREQVIADFNRAFAQSQPHPVETFRLPKAGRLDPYFGGTRSFWNARILPTDANGHKPDVASIVVKLPGAKRGIRFIIFDSAHQYFSRLAKEQHVELPGSSPNA